MYLSFSHSIPTLHVHHGFRWQWKLKPHPSKSEIHGLDLLVNVRYDMGCSGFQQDEDAENTRIAGSDGTIVMKSEISTRGVEHMPWQCSCIWQAGPKSFLSMDRRSAILVLSFHRHSIKSHWLDAPILMKRITFKCHQFFIQGILNAHIRKTPRSML